jgi:NAD(P)H-hydrate epimerase
MENAGLAVAEAVREALGEVRGRRVVVLVGPGNNGGDGLVAARHLHDWGARAQAYLLVARGEDDANLRQVVERGAYGGCAEDDAGFAALDKLLAEADAVVDALLGTGRPRPIGGPLAEVLTRLGRARQRPEPPRLIAVDLPTGLDCDTGAVDRHCVPANLTVTLAYSKVGLHSAPGSEYVGRLKVADIGIPPELGASLPVELMTDEWVSALLPLRPLDANKGTFGRVLVVAGSRNYVGAAYLATAAAARVGAGLTTLACPESLHPILSAKLTEATHLPLPEEAGSLARQAADPALRALSDYDVLLIGCGIGQSANTQAFVRALLFALEEDAPKGIVIDADGLNALARVPNWWEELKAPAVITPHPGEMARLARVPIAEVQANRVDAAQRHASLWDKTVVLKGANSVVAAPDGRVALSPFANPALASAGTGDVLAGAIAGMLAQGLPPFQAAACGVYLHATAAERLRPDLGEAGLVARDLLPELPRSIRALKDR